MATNWTFFFVWLIPGFLILGIFLLWRGWRPRRRGEAPHCRQCEYNLTGLQSDRCPECGNAIAADSIVYGTRYKRPGLIATGVVSLLLGVVLSVGTLSNVNWYPYKPTGWIINDIQSANATVSRKGWAEFTRRFRMGGISERHQTRMIELSLVEQGRPATAKVNPRLGDYVDFLGDAFLQGLLSEEQEATFFKQTIQMKVHVRPTVVLGDPVPVSVTYHGFVPSSPWWCRISSEASLLDGEPIRALGGVGTFGGVGSSGSSGGRFECSTPGTHVLEGIVAVKIFTGPSTDPSEGTTRHDRAIPFSVEFEVVSEEPAGYFNMVDDPAILEDLLDCLEPYNFTLGPDQLKGIIMLRRLPINVAFDIIARTNGEEVSLGTLVRQQGVPGTTRMLNWYKDELPYKKLANNSLESIDLILRSNEKLVRESVDMFEAWQGELVYKDVPVEVIAPAEEE